MVGGFRKDEKYHDEILELKKHFATSYSLNDKLLAEDLFITPAQQNPLSGLDRLGNKKHSLIVASPKQQLKVVPTGNSKWPHLLHSTGCITEPYYKNDKTGKLAQQDHVIGGLIVEVSGDEFYIRQIRADKNGHFIDLNKKYSPSGSKELNSVEAFVLGDLHCGSEDPTAMQAWEEVIKKLKPKRIVLHDLFDGKSVNHHVSHLIESKSKTNEEMDSLKTELDMMSGFLKCFSKQHSKSEIVVVKSNHDEFLERYLKEARYKDDYTNYRLALELAIMQYDGDYVLEEYVNRKVGKLKNVTWLQRDEDLIIKGTQLASHGDLGLNGARGNAGSTEKAYSDAIVGHAHTPNILREVFTVGTSTKLKID
jgi:hypothetical protein